MAFTQGFSEQFFGLQSALLSAQLKQSARMADQFTTMQDNALALVDATSAAANYHFYDLAAKQTAYLNTLATTYAAIAAKAGKDAGKRGLFSFIFG
jgi:hypothetical protein